jgi:hypothetical protein
MICVFVGSTFPALSQAAYLTVVVVETLKAVVKLGLASVGTVPSVV